MRTNEEKRVRIYETTDEPTVPSKVTPETPLENLNLNWREKDLPERERTKHVHRLHPYLGKFIPQLVEVFLRKYFKPGQTVLDPFCGSGTTIVQANELGINTIGCDISFFNTMLCQAKVTKYNVVKAREEILDILEKVHILTQPNDEQCNLFQKEVKLPSLPKVKDKYLKEWFHPQALKELLTYRHLIETEDYQYKHLLNIILSRSARSSRLTTHFDLDFPKKPQTEPYHCYKHSRICKPTHEAYKFFKRYSMDTINRIEHFASKRTDASISLHHVDSRNFNFPPIDGVITSPPYVGLIDYHEQHVYGYCLLGLEDRSKLEIGKKTNGSGQLARKQYQEDIVKVFLQVKKSLPSGGRIIVVANDKLNLYDDIAKQIEVDTEYIVNRHVNRRTGRRAGEYYESVFVWRKP